MAGRLVTLLTGERGAGKSTVCLRLGELARASGAEAAGIASRARIEAGERRGLDAVDLATGDSWPLASTVEALGGPAIGRFSFSPPGLGRALACLGLALESGASLVVVDEIGPLEVDRREGFAPFLERLRLETRADVLLVVRPSLVAAVRALVGPGRFRVVEVTPGNRDSLPLDLTPPRKGV